MDTDDEDIASYDIELMCLMYPAFHTDRIDPYGNVELYEKNLSVK